MTRVICTLLSHYWCSNEIQKLIVWRRFCELYQTTNCRTCWINPQCRSMLINENQFSGIGPNVDEQRSLSINSNHYRSILLNKDQCKSMPIIAGSEHVCLWSSIDRHWSLLSQIYLSWSELIGNDLYWAIFWINCWKLIAIDRHWGLVQHVLKLTIAHQSTVTEGPLWSTVLKKKKVFPPKQAK